MISQRYIRKPRKEHRCMMCEKKITGHHIYCYGGEEFVGKPAGIRICQSCALNKEAIIEKVYLFAVEHMTRLVTIPACQEHEGFYSTNVRLIWTCPVCGGPRGDVYETISYDGSRRLGVHGWRNPCGHVDFYGDCRQEAKANGLNV